MARRTPVIASNRSSIPEVARGAAILVDPDDVEGLGDAMRHVGADVGLRKELTRRGAEVASGFSWDETARATVAAYQELCAAR
jgi:glycosyltransferase involved in cell wall biosynthesis